jgi:O-antigen/teichoic acid export membrane protein
MAPLTPPDASDTRSGDLRRLARGTSWNLAGSVISASVHLLLPIMITRGLASDEAGAFFSVTALFAMLMTFGTVGADTGVLWALPRAKALDQSRDVPRVLRVALVPVAVVSVVAAIAMAILAPSIARIVAGDSLESPGHLVQSLYVLALVLPVAAMYAVAIATSRGLASVKPLVFIDKLGRNTLQTALVGLALLTNPSLLLAVVAWAAPYGVAMIVMGITVQRLVQKVQTAQAPSGGRSTRDMAREFWGFSGPRAMSRIFAVALQRFDILLVGVIRGLDEAAVYAAASRFVLLGLMFVQAIQQVMAPRISEFLAKGDVPRAHTIYETTTAWLTLVSWPIYVTSAIFAPFLIGVFGEGYARGTTVVVILCLTMLLATACGPVDTVLLMGGRSRWSLLNTGMALATNVTIDLLLVPPYGIVGAAIGWAAAIVVNNLAPLYQVHRFLGMHPFGGASIRAAAIASACFGGWGLIGRLVFGATLSGCLLAVLVGGLSFLLCLRWQQRALGIDALVSIVRRRGRR